MSQEKLNQLLEELKKAQGIDSFQVLNGDQDFQSSTGKTVIEKTLNSRQKVVFQCSGDVSPQLEIFVENWMRQIRQWESITAQNVSDLIFHQNGLSRQEKIKLRLREFLLALVSATDACQGFVVYKGNTISHTPFQSQKYTDQLPLLIRRLDKLAMESRASSHSTWITKESFACSFYYGAALCLFFDKPYSLDFTKHRSKHVCKEMSLLLAEMGDPELPPVNSNPVD